MSSTPPLDLVLDKEGLAFKQAIEKHMNSAIFEIDSIVRLFSDHEPSEGFQDDDMAAQFSSYFIATFEEHSKKSVEEATSASTNAKGWYDHVSNLYESATNRLGKLEEDLKGNSEALREKLQGLGLQQAVLDQEVIKLEVEKNNSATAKSDHDAAQEAYNSAYETVHPPPPDGFWETLAQAFSHPPNAQAAMLKAALELNQLESAKTKLKAVTDEYQKQEERVRLAREELQTEKNAIQMLEQDVNNLKAGGVKLEDEKRTLETQQHSHAKLEKIASSVQDKNMIESIEEFAKAAGSGIIPLSLTKLDRGEVERLAKEIAKIHTKL